jgi:hypothetical protein
MSEKTLDELVKDLQLAKESYESAQQRERFARNETTSCLNRLNAAQKAVDARMQTLRKHAPRDSDWARETRSSHVTEVKS